MSGGTSDGTTKEKRTMGMPASLTRIEEANVPDLLLDERHIQDTTSFASNVTTHKHHHQHPSDRSRRGQSIGILLRRSGQDLKITLLAGRGERKARPNRHRESTILCNIKQIDDDILSTGGGGKSSSSKVYTRPPIFSEYSSPRTYVNDHIAPFPSPEPFCRSYSVTHVPFSPSFTPKSCLPFHPLTGIPVSPLPFSHLGLLSGSSVLPTTSIPKTLPPSPPNPTQTHITQHFNSTPGSPPLGPPPSFTPFLIPVIIRIWLRSYSPPKSHTGHGSDLAM